MAKKRRAVNVANADEATSAVSSQGVVHVGDLICWTAAGSHVGFLAHILDYTGPDYCRKIYAYVLTLDRDYHFAWRRTVGTAILVVVVSRLRTLMYAIAEDGTCAIVFPRA